MGPNRWPLWSRALKFPGRAESTNHKCPSPGHALRSPRPSRRRRRTDVTGIGGRWAAEAPPTPPGTRPWRRLEPMKGARRLRSPALVLLLLRPLLASGDSASRPQARAMNPDGGGGGGSARGSPENSHYRLQRSTVPGSEPQRSNELLLLTSGEGYSPEQRHHVLYFPGDVQVTRARPPRHAHTGSHTKRVRGAPRFLPEPHSGKGPWRATVSRERLSGRGPPGGRSGTTGTCTHSPQPGLGGLCVLGTQDTV